MDGSNIIPISAALILRQLLVDAVHFNTAAANNWWYLVFWLRCGSNLLGFQTGAGDWRTLETPTTYFSYGVYIPHPHG